VDFVEICNVYIGKMMIKAAKRIFNSDKICRSYSDLNFGVTFFGTQCIISSSSSTYISANAARLCAISQILVRHITYNAICLQRYFTSAC